VTFCDRAVFELKKKKRPSRLVSRARAFEVV
jgi:hypothetical protein